jgi:hypothetical protein
VCVRSIACYTETSKRSILSPSWAVAPQKLLFCFHFYKRTSLEVSYDPYLFYQIGMKTIKITLFWAAFRLPFFRTLSRDGRNKLS